MSRSPFFRSFALSSAALALLAPALMAGEIQLSVQHSGKVDTVVGSFQVHATSPTLWGVLTDYEKLPQFIPALKTSRVKERRGNSVLLEHRAQVKFLFFSRTADLTLRLSERPYEEISFEEISHRDFEFYRGSWRIMQIPLGLEVHYKLETKRKFHVPSIIVRNVIKKNVKALLESTRAETLRRTKG
jgi:ribosome-associated toxin RatA of RatAB toxin-antitoxin module